MWRCPYCQKLPVCAEDALHWDGCPLEAMQKRLESLEKAYLGLAQRAGVGGLNVDETGKTR